MHLCSFYNRISILATHSAPALPACPFFALRRAKTQTSLSAKCVVAKNCVDPIVSFRDFLGQVAKKLTHQRRVNSKVYYGVDKGMSLMPKCAYSLRNKIITAGKQKINQKRVAPVFGVIR